MMPAVILALTISPSVASMVVMVAAVPTMSVTANPVMFALRASSDSTSTVVIVAAVPTISVTARPVMFALAISPVFTSNVVIEAEDKSLVKAEASIPLKVELKGVKAAIMPTELSVGLGGQGQLSGRLSEDLDNSDVPWAFDWYCTTIGKENYFCFQNFLKVLTFENKKNSSKIEDKVIADACRKLIEQCFPKVYAALS